LPEALHFNDPVNIYFKRANPFNRIIHLLRPFNVEKHSIECKDCNVGDEREYEISFTLPHSFSFFERSQVFMVMELEKQEKHIVIRELNGMPIFIEKPSRNLQTIVKADDQETNEIGTNIDIVVNQNDADNENKITQDTSKGTETNDAFNQNDADNENENTHDTSKGTETNDVNDARKWNEINPDIGKKPEGRRLIFGENKYIPRN
jgi:hypothetical protein